MNYTNPIERLRAPYRLVAPFPDARVLELSVRGPEGWLARHWRGGQALTAATQSSAEGLNLNAPSDLGSLDGRFDLIILHDFLDRRTEELERQTWLRACARRLAPSGVLAFSLANPWSLTRLGSLARQYSAWRFALPHPLRRIKRFQTLLTEQGLAPGGLYAMAPDRDAPAYLINLWSDDYRRHRLAVFGVGYTPWHDPRLWLKSALVYSGLTRLTEPAYFYWAVRRAETA